jgi:hypothetical protein
MTNFETAKAFFHACESLEGWAGCKQYVADGAVFSAQCEPLAEFKTVEEYTEWMAAVGNGPLAGCRYELISASYDEETETGLFFSVFHATHNAEGGPVPPTGKSTSADYVYFLKMNSEGKVSEMIKIWNAPWALRDLGWM